jgi:hypothetical protein
MTNQSARQASIRAVTGTTGTYNEDWLALFDLDGIPAGTFNERLYMWLEIETGLSGLTLNELMVAYAVLQGVETWNELGALALDPLDASVLSLHPASDRGAEDDDLITNDPAPRVLVDAPAGVQVGNTLNFYVGSVEQVADALVLTQDDLDGLTEIRFSDLGVDDTYGLQVSITNGNGESPLSNTVSVVVDTSLGACSVELTAGGLTTDDTTPELTVTFAGGVENDVAVIERDDGFVLGTKTLDGTDETNGTAAITLSELTEDDHDIVAYVYGTATGSGAGTFTEAAEETLTVAAEFHPSSLADIALVLDAMDAASLFQSNAGTTAVGDGDPVGFWGDGSGAGFNLTSLADDTTRPLFSTTGYNHLVGNGTSSLLQRTASLGLYEAGEFSIFIALKSNSNSTFSDLFSMAHSTNGVPRFFLVSAAGTATSDTAQVRDDASTGASTPATANAYNGSDVVLGKVEDGSNWTIYVDGVPAGPTAWTRPGAMTLNRTALFGRRGGTSSNWWAGDVAGVVAVKRAVTSGEAAQITTWLGLRQGRAL